MKSINHLKSTSGEKLRWHWGALVLAVVLMVLFWRSFSADYVHFSNDGPLGQQNSTYCALPAGFTGGWDDISDVGYAVGSASLGLTTLVFTVLGPLGFAKYGVAVGLFILGLGAWTFFRALRLSNVAVLLGALAMMLNSNLFAESCWGLAAHPIALGMDFFALALVMSNQRETPGLIRWVRLALAGLCVGINVIEAADIGALCSLVIAAFVAYKAWVDAEGGAVKRLFRGASQVAVIAVFAGFIACQTILSLVGTSIQGVSGTSQNAETKAQQWDWATQWSLPKKETLGFIVPGLFGYKMDTPKDMMPTFQDSYRGGVYWGGIGRSPDLDRYLDAGGKGAPPNGFMRFSGGGYYCGLLVLLVAGWGLAQSLRRKASPFSEPQNKLIWFWAGLMFLAVPLGWGRFAPGSHYSSDCLFYALLYKLPYFSTIRNPIKFLFFFSWAVVILFAYGMHALSLRYLDANGAKGADLKTQLHLWWARVGEFDRKFTFVCAGCFGAGLLGWLIYSGQQNSLVQYLQAMGFGEESMARQIAAFSFNQVTLWLIYFAAAIGLVIALIAGFFNGSRARLGAGLLGAFLLLDLGRADLPYVVHWDYKQKNEVGMLNPVVDFLKSKPYAHRVAALPLRPPQGLELLDQLYRIEWMQHLFPYYNIQCLDWIQMSRVPADLKTYLEALSPRGTPESVQLMARRWQLANTDYFLGAAGFLDALNQQLDPVKRRFRIIQRFTIALKPGVTDFHQRLEELTAYPKADGEYALFEFTGALPRASLYGSWQVITNDTAVLKSLGDLSFDPAKTVLVDTAGKNLPAAGAGENSGTVEFKSYAPKKIVLAANAPTSSVLLLNDKYDPNWRVTVDGQAAELLRCNYLMRGVVVPPGAHTVEFDFSLPHRPLYVTLSAIAVGLVLSILLIVWTKRGKSEEKV